MTMCWSHITGHFNKKKDSYKIHNFYSCIEHLILLEECPYMSSFRPDVKKFPGTASCVLRLLIAQFFGWNRNHSGGTLSQSDTPEKLISLRHFWESLKWIALYTMWHQHSILLVEQSNYMIT